MDYNVNDTLVRKGSNKMVIPLDKQSTRWEEDNYGSIRPKRMLMHESSVDSYDSVRAY